MLKFSQKKDFFFLNIVSLLLFSCFNLLFFHENYGVFAFFFSHNVLQVTIIDQINYYYGFSFIPCLIIAFYSWIKDCSYFYLYFFYMLSIDFLFALFNYGGGISSCVYMRFGFWVTFACFLGLLSFSWLLCLYLILETKKQEQNRSKKKNEVIPNSAHIEKEKRKNVHLPSTNLLSIGKKEDVKINFEEQKVLLIKTLGEFGVEAKVIDFFIGPVVTLYSIELAPGIKSIRVINLAEDIARSMEAFSVRISSIPGKNLLGVEISNPKRQFVYFKEGIQSEEYINFDGNLPLYLGCNIYGEHEVFDLSTMPHLLVAGTTGSGKSVGIHTMLLS